MAQNTSPEFLQSPAFEKLKLDAVKATAKALKISQTGEKATIVWRARLHASCTLSKLNVDGKHPLELTKGELKKACARHGIFPDGSPDELLQGLVDKLKAAAPAAGSGQPTQDVAQGQAAPAAPASTVDPIKVAKQVLMLSEQGECEAILNIAASKGEKLTKASPLAALRKAYLKISMLIHPDKLMGFDDATKSFQALCAAFEELTKPDLPVDGKDTKTKKLARSNEGCVVTIVKCPRCRVRWGQQVDGTPDYFYNFMMSGLKSYTCSTCLFEFGCMAAVHCCFYCKKEFEYSPGDFHRKIQCGNKKCAKTFGFFEHHIAERTMKQCIAEAKADYERLARQREAKQRRAASQARRGHSVNEEQVFLLGLDDSCPRCGEFFGKGYSEEDKRDHLRNCMDTVKHKAHAKQKKKMAEKQQGRERQAEKQADMQAKATWEVLGGRTDQLWLLPDGQLQIMAKESGLDDSGTREELISLLAAHRGGGSATHALPSSAGGGGMQGKAKRMKLTAESLPSNMHGMSLEQLRGVCAAHGFVPKGVSKADVLHEIEMELDSDKPLMLKAGGEPTPSEAPIEDEEDESDEEFRDTDEDEPLLKRKAKKAAPKPPPKKPKVVQIKDSESDDEDEPLLKRKGKNVAPKPPPKKPKVVQIQDSESDDEDEPLSKRQQKPKQVIKIEDSESDDEDEPLSKRIK